MSFNSIICDSITRIKNATLVQHKVVELRSSKLTISVLSVLKNEGYIEDFVVFESKTRKLSIKVYLKYNNEGRSVIQHFSSVSKPGRRVYTKSDKIPRKMDGLGTVIISTSQGVLPDYEVRNRKIGGEVIATIA